MFTGLVGELTVDTDKKTVVVHDGATPGGTPLAVAATSVAKTSNTGSMRVPSGTTAQRDVAPAYGDQRANNTTAAMEWWNGAAWVPLGGAEGGGVFYLSKQSLNEPYTIPAGTTAISGDVELLADLTLNGDWSIV